MMKEWQENKKKQQVSAQARELINTGFQEFVGCGWISQMSYKLHALIKAFSASLMFITSFYQMNLLLCTNYISEIFCKEHE